MTEEPSQGDDRLDDDGEAPELHNSEQEDEDEQSQTVAEEALEGLAFEPSPLDSTKVNGGLDDDSTQDLIDHMRDMEQSGRIDMDAYAGEENLDDNEDKYGEALKPDPDLTGDGLSAGGPDE